MTTKGEILDRLELSIPADVQIPPLSEQERQFEKEFFAVCLPINLLELCDNVYQFAIASTVSSIHSTEDHCWGLRRAAIMAGMSLAKASQAAKDLEAKGLLVIEPILSAKQLHSSSDWRHCSYCELSYNLTDRHHIIPRNKGGTDDPDNITYLCPNCHRLTHTLNYTPVWRL